MNNKVIKICKEVIKEGSIALKLNDGEFLCTGVKCEECCFSSFANPNGTPCGRDSDEYYINTAKEYIKKHEDKANIKKSFTETISTIEDGEMWESENYIVRCNKGEIEIELKQDVDGNFVVFKDSEIFSKVLLWRSFEEAFEAYEEGKIIESCISYCLYKRENGKDLYSLKGDEWFGSSGFEVDEIRGKWNIK